MAFINGPVPELVERLVTATPAQFERDLRAAWPAVTGSSAQGSLQLEHDDGQRLRIDLEVLPVRRLGLFVLPQLRAVYRFDGDEETARRRWLEILDRAMQKGGG
ncbi:MAG: hypothetical protein Q7J47_16220 [Azoarcus sp.]|nr:hypothetical protein [Azoarcus sp.]